ncbi:unnamed protein product, partial [Thlaspi arvense]
MERDMLVQLIAFYSSEYHRRCSYIGKHGHPVKMTSTELARALRLPPPREITEKEKEIVESEESVRFLEEVVRKWMLLPHDGAVVVRDLPEFKERGSICSGAGLRERVESGSSCWRLFLCNASTTPSEYSVAEEPEDDTKGGGYQSLHDHDHSRESQSSTTKNKHNMKDMTAEHKGEELKKAIAEKDEEMKKAIAEKDEEMKKAVAEKDEELKKAVAEKDEELKKVMKEMNDKRMEERCDLEQLEYTNSALLIKERQSNDEIQEARRELIRGLRDLSGSTVQGTQSLPPPIPGLTYNMVPPPTTGFDNGSSAPYRSLQLHNCPSL